MKFLENVLTSPWILLMWLVGHIKEFLTRPRLYCCNIIAKFIFLTPFLFLYEVGARYVFNVVILVGNIFSMVVMAGYNLLIIWLWKKMENINVWADFYRGITITTGRILYYDITNKLWKTVVFAIVFLVTLSYTMAMSPWFNFLTDQDIIFADNICRLFTNKKDLAESRLVRQGEKWSPPGAGPGLSNWVKDATEEENLRRDVLPAVVAQESSASFAKVPGLKGDTGGGSTQQQSAFQDDDYKMTGRRKSFMNGSRDVSTLEWQRLRHLTMICGLNTGNSAADFFLDYVKYFVVSNIDQRFSKKGIFKTASKLRQYHNEHKARYPKLDEDEYWRAAISAWHYGQGKKGWNNRHSAKIDSLYLPKGKWYLNKYYGG